MAYEQAWDGITPDWTVLSEAREPVAFIEVHTDDPPQRTFAQMRAWHGLVERMKKIPVPVVMQLAATGASISPPDAGTAKKIAQDVHTQIVRNPIASVFRSRGYTFLVAGDTRRRGQPMVSPLDMHAAFDPPSSRAGAVGAKDLMKRIEDKAHKYRELAGMYGVPLIVAVGAHRFTGVTLGHLDDVLRGLPAPKMTFQFNAGDTHICQPPFVLTTWVGPGDTRGERGNEGLTGVWALRVRRHGEHRHSGSGHGPFPGADDVHDVASG